MLIAEIQVQRTPDAPSLTPREREVLALAADSLKTCQIAHQLNVGATTVKKHQQSAYDKLGAFTCAGAVASALRLGLID